MQSERSRLVAVVVCCLSVSALVGLAPGLVAQDFTVLRINEVITDNETTGPVDSTGERSGTFVLSLEPTPGEPNKAMPEPLFRRGDVDGHCPIDLTDAVFILLHLFGGGTAPVCPDGADVDDNGGLELTDAVFLLNHLFQGGASPPLPGTEVAGPDPTSDDLVPCDPSPCP